MQTLPRHIQSLLEKQTNSISKFLFHNPCVPTGGSSPNFCKTIFSRAVSVVLLTAMFFTKSLCFPSVGALLSLQMEPMFYIAFISLGQTNQDLFFLLMTDHPISPLQHLTQFLLFLLEEE